jgi:hypothetical protein
MNVEYQAQKFPWVNAGRPGSFWEILASGASTYEAGEARAQPEAELRKPASSGERPLSDDLAGHQVDPRRIPEICRDAVRVAMDWAAGLLGGLSSVTVIWFDHAAAAPGVLGDFSLLANGQPVIWLSDAHVGDAIEAATTAVHELVHVHQFLHGGGESSEAQDEAEAEALARRFRRERRLRGHGDGMFVGWA